MDHMIFHMHSCKYLIEVQHNQSYCMEKNLVHNMADQMVKETVEEHMVHMDHKDYKDRKEQLVLLARMDYMEHMVHIVVEAYMSYKEMDHMMLNMN